jgi:serine/threonine-protein kinase RsbW
VQAAARRGSPEVELDLPAAPRSVRKAREAIAELAQEVGAPVDDVRLAVSEAVGNAVSHAFRGTDPGTVRLLAAVEGGRLVVTVSDDGTGMRPNPDTKGMGMGIPLITKLSLDARFDSTDSGTTVSMTFPAEAYA